MAAFTGHCRGCNQDFPADQEARCPQCGEQLTVASDSPTLDLDETMPGGPGPHRIVIPTDLTTQLVGHQLQHYDVQQFLGQGGMAIVFQARHQMLQRPCALKVLRPDLGKQSQPSLDLFLREARAAASLVHPHVVAVHNIGHDQGLHYIELEYVAGQSLQGLLRRRQTFPTIEATDYLLQACSALAEAHHQGFVHRDFKPANILVRHDGVAKLADFGLAKRVAPTHGVPTDQGLAGTPYYMAPELFRGAPGSPASDVYAAGITYYYLLTGQFPFQDSNIARLARLHEQAPVPDPRQLDPDIPAVAVQLLQRALHKDPHQRFPHGAALQEHLLSLFTQLRSLRSIVLEALEGIPGQLQPREDDVLEVLVSLSEGRSQTIHICERCSDAWAINLVRVSSVCAPATADYYQRALELNAEVPHGSLAIEELDGVPHFVMLNSYLRCRCDPLEIRHSIMDIARWADDIERALTGQDQF